MNDPIRDAAQQRYHEIFDSQSYNAIGDLMASNLLCDRDSDRAVDGMVALQDACLELCGHPDHIGACHRLARFCGLNLLLIQTIEAMTAYLRRFPVDEDVQVDDFRHTACALLKAQLGLDDLKTAASYANGVHGWQGRMAYALLYAVEYLTLAAIHLLLRGDDAYIREKLRLGLGQIVGALHEGLFHSDQPKMYDFSSMRLPKTRR